MSTYNCVATALFFIQACPTSSVYTSSNTFEDHALQAFARDGVSFSLNTDDPGIIHCSLTNEYDVTESRIGLTQHQIMRSVRLIHAQVTFYPIHHVYTLYIRCCVGRRLHFYHRMKKTSL